MINHKKALIIFLSTLLVGCSTHYVEQVTAPSTVVSPLPQTRNQTRPLTPSLLDSQTMEPEQFVSNGSSYTESRSTHSGQRVSSQGTYQPTQFRRSYKKAKQPKMALFLYRELSQDILDYDSKQRLVFAGQYKNDKGNLIVAKQNSQTIDSGARRLSSTNWAWQFEDNLMNNLLASGVKLVDRATIMRLVASTVDSSKDSTGMLSVKKIEMDALKGFADIFVEVLISPSSNSNQIYNIRLIAKKVRTGEILATVTSTGKDFSGDDSYEEQLGNIVDKIEPIGINNIKKTVSVEKVAHWVADTLKNKLSMYWLNN